jgi:nucleotide-binding universal stress UspA family protein
MSNYVIASELSKLSENAIKTGASWAKAFGKKPIVTYADSLPAIENVDYLFTSVQINPITDNVNDILKADEAKLDESLKAIGLEEVTHRALAGFPEKALVDEMKADANELLFVGYDPSKADQTFFLGGVTESLIHRSSKSVVVAKDDRAINPKKILVAVDFSYHCEEALKWTKRLQERFGSEVHIINVVPNYVDNQAFSKLVQEETNQYLAKLNETIQIKAQEQLDEAVAKVFSDSDKVSKSLVKDTQLDISEAINDYANKNDIDLVVTGTHGRGRITRFFLGSVANKLARLTEKSLFIVK